MCTSLTKTYSKHINNFEIKILTSQTHKNLLQYKEQSQLEQVLNQDKMIQFLLVSTCLKQPEIK